MFAALFQPRLKCIREAQGSPFLVPERRACGPAGLASSTWY